MQISEETDVSHLGVLIGDPSSDRIIAVSTSAVFEDGSLPQKFWGIDGTAIDSGFQGHMYARSNDILVVRVPSNDDAIAESVTTAIDVNYEIWKSLTGIQLSSMASQIILVSDNTLPPTACLPVNCTWHVGSLLDAAVTRYHSTRETFLAFVLNNKIADMLGLRDQGTSVLLEHARKKSLLMDKNSAMRLLQSSGIDCARTYSVNEDTKLVYALSAIPSSGRYVFKPAGGAAGIGVFSNDGRGASLDLIVAHLEALKRKDQLMRRFQIQEFVPGTPYGVTAYFEREGSFEILEIHRQSIDKSGRFTGGRWNPALQADKMAFVNKLCRQMAAIEQPSLSGLICLDIIDRRLIEVNPRLTASAPIAHILRRQNQIARHLGSNLQIDQIDLNTKVPIPYESIRNGTLRRLIDATWEERGALVLPQGLNPFGDSRIVFINDDDDGTAQRLFIQGILQT